MSYVRLNNSNKLELNVGFGKQKYLEQNVSNDIAWCLPLKQDFTVKML